MPESNLIDLTKAAELGYSWATHADEAHTLEVFKDGEPAFQVSSDTPLFTMLVVLNDEIGLDLRAYTQAQIKALTGE